MLHTRYRVSLRSRGTNKKKEGGKRSKEEEEGEDGNLRVRMIIKNSYVGVM